MQITTCLSAMHHYWGCAQGSQVRERQGDRVRPEGKRHIARVYGQRTPSPRNVLNLFPGRGTLPVKKHAEVKT
jgi:hypothetical protein